MLVSVRVLGQLGIVWLAAVWLAACAFDSSPVTGGPGLEPPVIPGTDEDRGAPSVPTGTPTMGPAAGSGAVGNPTTPPPPVTGGDPSPPAQDAAVPVDAGVAPADAGGADAGDAAVDAGTVETCDGWTPPEGESCPEACTSCDATLGVCAIDCTDIFVDACSDTQLNCPRGWACRVDCTGLGVCTGLRVDCEDAPCEIDCTGLGSCQDLDLRCGSDRCAVACTPFSGTIGELSSGDSCGAITIDSDRVKSPSECW